MKKVLFILTVLILLLKVIKIYNKTELAYVMAYYGISEVPVFDRHCMLGKVVLKDGVVSFQKGPNIRMLPGQFEEQAFAIAFEAVNDVITLKEKWNEETVQNVIYRIEYYGYPKSEDSVNVLTWSGTYDQLFEKMSYKISRLRYLNGHSYEFADPEMQKLYRIWQEVIPNSRSFDIYYRNATVD